MIDLDRFTIFARSFEQDLPAHLEELRSEAISQGIPIIRREMQGLLRFLLCVSRPQNVLEIGSGIGFSALFMRACLEEYQSQASDFQISTIEISHVHAEQTRRNIVRFGAQKSIHVIEADAAQVLNEVSGPFQFVFLDGPKGQYAEYLPVIIDKLDAGGILVADNILKEGEIMESRFAVARRQRTIHARMHAFVYAVTHEPRLVSCILPIGDGVSVSVKRSRKLERNDINKKQ